MISCTLELRITLLDQISYKNLFRVVWEMWDVLREVLNSSENPLDQQWELWRGLQTPLSNKKPLCSVVHLPLLTLFPCVLWNLQSSVKNGASLGERLHCLNWTRSFLLRYVASTFLQDDLAICHVEGLRSTGAVVAGNADSQAAVPRVRQVMHSPCRLQLPSVCEPLPWPDMHSPGINNEKLEFESTFWETAWSLPELTGFFSPTVLNKSGNPKNRDVFSFISSLLILQLNSVRILWRNIWTYLFQVAA